MKAIFTALAGTWTLPALADKYGISEAMCDSAFDDCGNGGAALALLVALLLYLHFKER